MKMNLSDVIKIREEILEEVVSENFLGLLEFLHRAILADEVRKWESGELSPHDWEPISLEEWRKLC